MEIQFDSEMLVSCARQLPERDVHEGEFKDGQCHSKVP